MILLLSIVTNMKSQYNLSQTAAPLRCDGMMIRDKPQSHFLQLTTTTPTSPTPTLQPPHDCSPSPLVARLSTAGGDLRHAVRFASPEESPDSSLCPLLAHIVIPEKPAQGRRFGRLRRPLCSLPPFAHLRLRHRDISHPCRNTQCRNRDCPGPRRFD